VKNLWQKEEKQKGKQQEEKEKGDINRKTQQRK